MKSSVVTLSTHFLYFFPLIILCSSMSCRQSNSVPNVELDRLELLRGELLLCGGEEFGQLSFFVSCKNATRKNFNLAVSLLHSFEYDEAEKAFVKVIDADPECAMAYWGVAMCNFHALWRPPTENDLKKGNQAIQIAKSIKGKTERETDYINAISIFYDNWQNVSHKDRIAGFDRAMEKIYEKYPTDIEAAIFYALSLNSSADLSDKSYKNRRKAGAILEKLFKEYPNHPGIAHYIIHSYDYPELAGLALSAARRYAGIAPSSSHAQHMPSHIFTRLGLWEESIQSNLKATSSAKCYSEQVQMKGHWDEEIHGVDYLVYAYLQQSKLSAAEALLKYLNSIENIYPIGVKGAYPSAAIPARFYLESRNWSEAAKVTLQSSDYPLEEYPWSNGIIFFARALGSIHIGDLASSKIALEQLNTCHNLLLADNDTYMANQVSIMYKAASAWVQYYEGNSKKALATMESAAEMEGKTEKQSLTPGEVLPAQELLGDLLLKMGMAEDALEAYELNLKIRPRRFNSLYGAALASKESGQLNKADRYFKELLELSQNADVERLEILEAKTYLATL